MALIPLDMDVLVFSKVSNDLFSLDMVSKTIVHRIYHSGRTASLARDLRTGS